MTLRARLTAAFLAVVLGPVLLGAVFVGVTVSAVSNQRAAERLQMGTTTVRTLIGSSCEQLRATARTVALLYGQGNQSGPQQAVRNDLAGGVIISDQTGHPTATAGSAPRPWAECGAQPTDPTRAVRQDRPSSLVARVALVTPTGSRVGEVVVATPVDARFGSLLGSAAGVDVTFFGGSDDPTLSTEPTDQARSVQKIAQGAPTGKLRTSTGGLYIQVVPPSVDQPLPIALSTGRTDSQALYAVLIGVVLLAGLFAVGAAWWLARSTTQPLEELAAAADLVASGDLNARVPVRSRDEVGKVGTSFNRMTREMQAYVSALTASRDQLRGNLGLLGDTLSSTHDLDRILEVILETAMAATGAQAGVVLLVERSETRYPGMLVARCADGIHKQARSLEQIRLRLGEGLLGDVAASDEPRRGRVDRDGMQLSPNEPNCKTYIAVPFSGHGESRSETDDPTTEPQQGRLLGVLALYDRLGHDDFDDSDLGTLRTFAGQAAVAVENVLLHQEAKRQSLTDPLTELWNYRYLRDSLRREVERATRFDRNLALLALDLDRFKEVNDTYGHAAGDAVLVAVADQLNQEIRGVDLAFRQGGEEFVALLPETDTAGAARVAERLCNAIRGMAVPLEPASGAEPPIEIKVTVSIGIAVFPDHGRTGQEVLEAADDALYEAKASGRNTWRVALPPSPRGPAAGPTNPPVLRAGGDRPAPRPGDPPRVPGGESRWPQPPRPGSGG